MTNKEPQGTTQEMRFTSPSNEAIASSPEEGPKTIKNLNILVHPYYLQYPTPIKGTKEKFAAVRATFGQTVIQRLTPTEQYDVLLFMPNMGHTDEDIKETIQHTAILRKDYPDFPQWPELFRAIQNKSGEFAQNVILMEDIVRTPLTGNDIMIRLLQRGFTINEQSTITIGGELLDHCVKDVVDQLLILPQVKTLRVDRKATLHEGYLFGEEYTSDSFKQRYETQEKYNVVQNEEYIYISKK